MKKIMLYFLILLASGCVTATDKNTPQRGQIKAKSQVAELQSFQIREYHLEFEVLSFGCTKAGYFKLDYNQVDLNKLNVTVVRLKPDYCKKKPQLKRIQLPLSDLYSANTLVSVSNPFKNFILKGKLP